LARALPSYQRVTRVLLSGEPLPRTRLGKLRRWEIAARLERENQAPVESDTAETDTDELLEFTRAWLKLPHTPRDSDSLEIDLGLDSLSRLEFLSAFERRFGLSLSESAAATAVSLGDLRPWLERAADGSGESVGSKPRTIKSLDQIADPGRGLFGRALRAFGWLVLRVFSRVLFRAEIQGLENLPDPPYILAPNHVSYLDWVVLYGMLPRRIAREVYSVGVTDILDRFPLSALCYHGRVIKTGTLATTALSLERSQLVLERGKPLIMFPEGKRSLDSRTDTPKRGLGLLAVRTGAAVVPVYIHGAWRSMSRAHPALRPVKISLEVMPPLDAALSERDLGRHWHTLMQERDPLD
ncbi:1-acyl-sn-glycerol-3-phosphate acyltransferase, partial [bacterium]|nr:1-acyl-sn-glycerol-3-phosphate acyltransferase [bacterium]